MNIGDKVLVFRTSTEPPIEGSITRLNPRGTRCQVSYMENGRLVRPDSVTDWYVVGKPEATWRPHVTEPVFAAAIRPETPEPAPVVECCGQPDKCETPDECPEPGSEENADFLDLDTPPDGDNPYTLDGEGDQ